MPKVLKPWVKCPGWCCSVLSVVAPQDISQLPNDDSWRSTRQHARVCDFRAHWLKADVSMQMQSLAMVFHCMHSCLSSIGQTPPPQYSASAACAALSFRHCLYVSSMVCACLTATCGQPEHQHQSKQRGNLHPDAIMCCACNRTAFNHARYINCCL